MNKNRIKSSYIILFTVLVILSCSAAANDLETTYPTLSWSCKNISWCDFTATEKTWPTNSFTDTVPFSNLTFLVNLPRSFSKITVLWGKSSHYGIHYNDIKVSISQETVPKIALKSENLKKAKSISNSKPIDIFKIIFSETSNSKEPTNEYEMMLWRLAFHVKAKQFDSATNTFKYLSGPWSVYSANVVKTSHSRVTIITHKDIGDQYLMILDTGMKYEFIESLISTVKLEL